MIINITVKSNEEISLQEAAQRFAANWGYDVNGSEELIDTTGKVLKVSIKSGTNIVSLATDAWIYREDPRTDFDTEYLVVNYKEFCEIGENELLQDDGPTGIPAWYPGEIDSTDSEEFDLLSTNFKSLEHVPDHVLERAAKLLTESMSEIDFEDFFTQECCWEYELPAVHPIVLKELEDSCHSFAAEIKSKEEANEILSAIYELEVALNPPISIQSDIPTYWTDTLKEKHFAIFKKKFGSGAREMGLAIKFSDWLDAQKKAGHTVAQAKGVWKGSHANELVAVFGITESDTRSQIKSHDLGCALYIEVGEIPRILS